MPEERRMEWPKEIRLAAISFDLPGLEKTRGVDIFVAEDPPGEFEDEATYVPASKLKEQEERCERLEEALRSIADVRGDGSMPGLAEVAERRGEIARAALQHSPGDEGAVK